MRACLVEEIHGECLEEKEEKRGKGTDQKDGMRRALKRRIKVSICVERMCGRADGRIMGWVREKMVGGRGQGQRETGDVRRDERRTEMDWDRNGNEGY